MNIRLNILLLFPVAFGVLLNPAVALGTGAVNHDGHISHHGHMVQAPGHSEHRVQTVQALVDLTQAPGHHVCPRAKKSDHARCCERLSEDRNDPSVAAGLGCVGQMVCCLITGPEPIPAAGTVISELRPESPTHVPAFMASTLFDPSSRPRPLDGGLPSAEPGPPAHLANCTLLL